MFGQESGKKEEAISLSEMDDKLMADKDGTYKKEVLDKLAPYLVKVKSKMAAGDLSPEEFEAAKKMEEALQAAQDLVRDR